MTLLVAKANWDLSFVYPVACWTLLPRWTQQNESKFECHLPQPAPLPDSFPGYDCQHQVRNPGALLSTSLSFRCQLVTNPDASSATVALTPPSPTCQCDPVS